MADATQDKTYAISFLVRYAARGNEPNTAHSSVSNLEDLQNMYPYQIDAADVTQWIKYPTDASFHTPPPLLSANFSPCQCHLSPLKPGRAKSHLVPLPFRQPGLLTAFTCSRDAEVFRKSEVLPHRSQRLQRELLRTMRA